MAMGRTIHAIILTSIVAAMVGACPGTGLGSLFATPVFAGIQNGREAVRTAANEEPGPGREEAADRSAEAGSTYDRIQRGAHFGKISLKEGVLLVARLLFAPGLIPADSEYAPRPGEPAIQPEESLTGFYKDLHRVKAELTEEEKSWLRSLSPDIEVIIGAKGK